MRIFLAILVIAITVLFHLVLDSTLGEAPLVGGLLPASNPAAQMPPLGRLLNPFTGFLQNAEPAEQPRELKLDMPGLRAPVTVVWDARMVPHIFAQNDHDLYYAQGYVTARMRLWQMDTQIRQAAGRLSEFAGPKALDTDRLFRGIGLSESARKTLQYMEQDPATREALQAYSDGINAHIDQIGYAQYPIEYKILNYAPEPWSPYKTALMLKLMAWNLTFSGANHDLALTNLKLMNGSAVMDSLWPIEKPFMDPVIPPSRKWDFDSVLKPNAPPAFALDSGTHYLDLLPDRLPSPDPNNGSNNWAVHGSRTASGYPMLANDPHLDLNLPSIWFEIQLHAPGVNAYGASLPGAPSVISGFNESVAWGITNVGADVLDWYLVKFRDESRKEYWHDGQWKPTTTLTDTINIRGNAPFISERRFTHHGPVVLEPNLGLSDTEVPHGCALRWMAHETGNEFLTFHRLNRSRSYDDYVKALETYSCPAQNFVFASATNDIALWCNGRYPLKWRGQGEYILDGTDPRHDWQGYVPHRQNPSVRNPERGFVSSANQTSTAPDYPYFLGAWQAEFERGARINEVLATFRKATPDSMRLLQDDNLSLEARKILPFLLKQLAPGRFPPGSIEGQAASTLANWDYQMRSDAVGAALFQRWWETAVRFTWADNFGREGLLLPRRDVTMYWMLTDSTLRWYDDARTPHRETLKEILRSAFDSTLAYYRTTFGPDLTAWKWGRVQDTYVPHIVKVFKPFGRFHLDANGCPLCVNSTKPHNGPSWRMVVALNPDPTKFEAYGLYPGGQSGNPGSRWYANMIPDWVQGKLHRLTFLRDASSAGNTALEVWTLGPR